MLNNFLSLRTWGDLVSSWTRADSFSRDLRDYGRTKEEWRAGYFIFLISAFLLHVVEKNFPRPLQSDNIEFPILILIFYNTAIIFYYKAIINFLITAQNGVDQIVCVKNSSYFFLLMGTFVCITLAISSIFSHFFDNIQKLSGDIFYLLANTSIFVFSVYKSANNINIVFGATSFWKAIFIVIFSWFVVALTMVLTVAFALLAVYPFVRT